MVRGLRKFIENLPDAREIIAIEKKIDQWKSDNPESTPIIVIDFGGFYRSLCRTNQAQIDLLFGKHNRLLKILEDTLKRFQKIGVLLQFFFGGPPRYVKNPGLIDSRRTQYFTDFDRIVKMIKLEKSPEFILTKLTGPIFNNGSYFVAAVMLAEKYGSVVKSFHNECVRDIALYASKHNALAVMSGNSDYTIMNGKWDFWDVESFDSSEFKIMQIAKTKVQDFLDLSDENLPLVGVLTGKYLPATIILNFLKSLGNKANTFENVAKFINNNFRDKSSNIPNAIAQFLSPYNLNENSKIAEEALKLFANRPDSQPVSEDELSEIVKRFSNSFVYEFLNDLPVPIQPLFLCKSGYTKFMNVALKIHQRQMGIVLQHKKTIQSRIFLYFTDSTFPNQPVCPILPTLEVPSLLHLYQETGDDNLQKTKLKLLCWITSDQLNYTAADNVAKPYLCAVLALVIMTENQFITSEEADCILYCIQQYNTDPETFNLLKHPKSIAERPFEVIFLYDKFHHFMVISMNTVGLSDMVVHNQLDGVYFHQQYEKFINLSGDERDKLLEMIKGYRLY